MRKTTKPKLTVNINEVYIQTMADRVRTEQSDDPYATVVRLPQAITYTFDLVQGDTLDTVFNRYWREMKGPLKAAVTEQKKLSPTIDVVMWNAPEFEQRNIDRALKIADLKTAADLVAERAAADVAEPTLMGVE